MSADKYPSIFSRQMETIVYLSYFVQCCVHKSRAESSGLQSEVVISICMERLFHD